MNLQLSNESMQRYYKPVIAVILLFYLINCFTPLRLETDSVRYFGIRDCIDQGCDPFSKAGNDFFPHGYPWLLLGLSSLGILNSFFIVLINCIYLFTSIWLIKKIFPSVKPFAFILLVLFNWVIIKFVAYPLSEMQYLFFSILSLYFFNRFKLRRKYASLLVALVFAILAFLTRTAGIALLFALVDGFLSPYKEGLIKAKGWKTFILSLVAVGAVMLAAVIFIIEENSLWHYISIIAEKRHPDNGIGRMIVEHFREWGQLALNTPAGKLRSLLPGTTGDWLLIIIGIVFIAFFIYRWIRVRKMIPGFINTYLIAYFIVVFNWTYYDPRFWLPVLPLVVMILLQSPPPRESYKQKLLALLFVFYVAMGSLAFVYSLYTQFNKKELSRTQAGGIFKKEYETHFFGKPLNDTSRNVDTVVLGILKRYD